MTANRYGQKMAPPFLVIVDRTGKIAFHSELATGDANVNATLGQIAKGSGDMSEEHINERIERACAERSSGFSSRAAYATLQATRAGFPSDV